MFRFIAISLLKWFVVLIVNMLLLQFVLPRAWTGYSLSASLWFVAFLISFFFAEWAFGKKFPHRHDVWKLLIVWMVISVTLQILHGIYVLGDVLYVINSPDFYVQYLLEILAILLAAQATRRRFRHSMATMTEGLSG
jgi:hypothetical protein